MSGAVLDASALLAIMLNEPGADVVEARFEGAVISAVNLAEVGAKMIERGATLELLETEIQAAEITVVSLDAAQAMESARLRPATKERGLSLATAPASPSRRGPTASCSRPIATGPRCAFPSISASSAEAQDNRLRP